jgi:hypothetical protein
VITTLRDDNKVIERAYAICSERRSYGGEAIGVIV